MKVQFLGKIPKFPAGRASPCINIHSSVFSRASLLSDFYISPPLRSVVCPGLVGLAPALNFWNELLVILECTLYNAHFHAAL